MHSAQSMTEDTQIKGMSMNQSQEEFYKELLAWMKTVNTKIIELELEVDQLKAKLKGQVIQLPPMTMN